MPIYIPRVKLHAYRQAEGEVLRTRKNMFKFTKGTDPNVKSMIQFVVDESISCPQFLPLMEEDAKLTQTVI